MKFPMLILSLSLLATVGFAETKKVPSSNVGRKLADSAQDKMRCQTGISDTSSAIENEINLFCDTTKQVVLTGVPTQSTGTKGLSFFTAYTVCCFKRNLEN